MQKSKQHSKTRNAILIGAAVLCVAALVIWWPRAGASHPQWVPQVHRAQPDTVESGPAPSTAELHGEPTGAPAGAWIPAGARR